MISIIKKLSIRAKMMAIIMTTTVIGMLLIVFALAAYQVQQERNKFDDEYTVLAKFVANRSSAAVVFGDTDLAHENIAALAGNPDVMGACVYGAQGEVLTYHFRSGKSACPVYRATTLSYFDSDYLHVYAPIMVDNQSAGSVYLRVQLVRLSRALTDSLGVMFVAMLIAILIAYLLASRLQHVVSAPILRLAGMAQRVASERDYSLRMEVTSSDEVGTLIGNVNDMLDTIRRQNRKLESAKDDLEHQVAQRTRDLQAANNELKSFSYSVSHDLRAPLRAINGFAAALLEDYAPHLDDDARHYLQRIAHGAEHMGELIDAMLKLSRLSNQELVLAQLDMSALAEKAIGRLRAADPQRQVDISIQHGMAATADGALVEAVYANLIGNAWKYTGKTAQPRIEVGATQDGAEWVFYVRDNGAGFDMNYASKLFGAFQRLHRQDEFEGIGIGLATVARVIHRHGGRVWAEGEPSRGATFFFTLAGSARVTPDPDAETA